MEHDLKKIVEKVASGKLRDQFDDLFPKDIEATMGIRPSKSRRSAALLLWADFMIELRGAVAEAWQSGRESIAEEIEEDMRKFREGFGYKPKKK